MWTRRTNKQLQYLTVLCNNLETREWSIIENEKKMGISSISISNLIKKENLILLLKKNKKIGHRLAWNSWKDLCMAVALWGSVRSRSKLCCRLISDSIMRLFYFTPRWLVGVTPWTRKAQKELYKRRQQQIGDEDVSFIFYLYFLGSTTIPWVGEFSMNAIEMVESSS